MNTIKIFRGLLLLSASILLLLLWIGGGGRFFPEFADQEDDQTSTASTHYSQSTLSLTEQKDEVVEWLSQNVDHVANRAILNCSSAQASDFDILRDPQQLAARLPGFAVPKIHEAIQRFVLNDDDDDDDDDDDGESWEIQAISAFLTAASNFCHPLQNDLGLCDQVIRLMMASEQLANLPGMSRTMKAYMFEMICEALDDFDRRECCEDIYTQVHERFSYFQCWETGS